MLVKGATGGTLFKFGSSPHSRNIAGMSHVCVHVCRSPDLPAKTSCISITTDTVGTSSCPRGTARMITGASPRVVKFQIDLGASQYKDAVLPIGIPIIKIRRSRDRLIFIMEISYLERPSLYWDRALDISGTFWLNAKLQNIGVEPCRHVSYVLFNTFGDIDCSSKMQCYEEKTNVHNVSRLTSLINVCHSY